MKVGDLVKHITSPRDSLGPCLVLSIDTSHRQTNVNILSRDGKIIKKVWIKHLEDINESKR